MDQFSENLKLFSTDNINAIQNKHVLIVGLGGLGGYIANGLARLGVKELTLVDRDTFSLTNLNRQLFSHHFNLGKSKVCVVKENLLKINPLMIINDLKCNLKTLKNDKFKTVDLIVDAVDNIKTRLYLESLANTLKLPILHGAIGGWYGQLGIILPQSNLLHHMYDTLTHGAEKELGSPTFTPSVIGNLMVTEYVKFMTHNEDALINKILYVDLQHHDYQIIIDKS